MFAFFDRVYFQFYLLTSSENETNKRDLANSYLTLLQAFNMLTIYFLLVFIFPKIPVSKFVVAAMGISLIVINYLRYQYSEMHNPTKLPERLYQGINETKLGRNNLLVYYIIASVITFIAAIILVRV